MHELRKYLDQLAPDAKYQSGLNELTIEYVINRVFELIPKADYVLELGFGEGLTCRLLSSKCKFVDCIEGSQELVNINYKKIQNVNIIVTLFEEFEEEEKKYDLIFMNHVLEHVKNPKGILLKYKKYLNEDGKIVIVVPNANSMHRLYGKHLGIIKEVNSLDEQDKRVGHLRVYNLEELKRDVEGAGLNISVIEGVLLKPDSNANLTQKMDKSQIIDLIKLGRNLPEVSAEIMLICN
jgi:2-polyprenyl-3-methyl-5-hydroxy-6-metoxy-1,4-benzoquinol methylase